MTWHARVAGSAAALTFIAQFASAQVPDRSAADAVDAIVRDLNQPGMPGCAIGVVRDGALAVSRVYGLADVENGVPIDRETHFDIGSMSKQFLAMEIFLLAAKGQLSLDGDIRQYVPELPAYPWPVTLRNLLHHTSGLKDYDQLLQIAGWADGNVKSANDIFWIIQRQKTLGFKPGTQYSYSDSNYFLLGFAAQRVSGKPLSALLQETVFAPLEMNQTALHVDRWALVPHKAWPYRIQNGKPTLFVNGEEPLGDGGIFTTVSDLARWERNFDDAKVGGPAVIAEMHRVLPLADGTANNYAAGLYLRTYRGQQMIEHSGASYGYVAEKLRFPKQHLSVIVLCNRRDAPYVQLSNRLADAFLGLPTSDTEKPATAVETGLEKFTGLYFSDRASDAVRLEAKGGRLLDAGVDRTYRPTGRLTFESAPAGLCRCSTTLTFHLAPDGTVTGYTETTPVGDLPGKQTEVVYARMRPARAAPRDDYAGEYVSDDVATSWCLLGRWDHLVIRRRGLADRPSSSLWEDAFDGPGGILQFSRANGHVTGFTLRNLRSHSTSFRKLPPGDHPVPAPVACP